MIKDKKKKKVKTEDIASQTLKERDYFYNSTITLRDEWEELWKLYIGELGESKHKSLSQNFIPKTHQAVELLASLLAGNQPSITTIPIGDSDEDKSMFMSKLVEFQWLYELKMKPKVLTWVKSGILFGVGVMKVGWDSEKDLPFAYPTNLGNIYTDPFRSNIQESIVIERIVKDLEDAKEQYGEAAKNLKAVKINGSDKKDSGLFNPTDQKDEAEATSPIPQVEIFERWTKKRYTVIASQQQTKDGKTTEFGLVLKDIENPYGFIPYVGFRFADSPLPNRFYTQGAIAPVKRVHKRMNQIINQTIDNTNLVMSPPAVIRKGSGVDPRQLQTFPGRGIYANDPERDIKWMSIPDTTRTGLQMYHILDREFQSGTTVTDIRLGQGSADSATEARIQQSNLNTQTNLVKENLEESIGDLGQMLVKLNIKYIDSVKTIRIFDPGDIRRFEELTNQVPVDSFGLPIPQSPEERADIQRNGRKLTIKKDDIDGEYDVRVKSDSTILQNREVLRKQLLDFAQLMSTMGVQIDTHELSERFSELTGIPNIHKIIKEEPLVQPVGPEVGPGGGQSMTPTGTSQGLTPRGVENMASNPAQRPTAMTS